MAEPRYLTIKRALVSHIEAGHWPPGTAVPSENALAERHRVSRMTARRALTELVEAGVLTRSQGAGTFVADQLPTGSLLTIRSIDEEISGRGHRHSAEVLKLERLCADDVISRELRIDAGSPVFFSRLLHFEEDTGGRRRPLQLEERYVNTAVVPDYLQQDFQAQTPSAYLQRVAPLTEADHWVEAVLPAEAVARWLCIDAQQPVLKLTRKTFSYRGDRASAANTRVVAFAILYHPGHRYRLGGHLRQTTQGVAQS